MNKRQFIEMMLESAAALKIGKSSGVKIAFQNKNPAVLDARLSEFLKRTNDLRGIFSRKSGGDRESDLEIASKLEKASLESFEKLADKGSRRYQFYIGNIYNELNVLTGDNKYKQLASKWLTVAAAQGHPDAVYRLIAGPPVLKSKKDYAKTIRLGSVSALADCSGYTLAIQERRNWMEVGPIVSFPERAAMDYWSEVFVNWMIIYFFLIQWDRKGEYLKLSLPQTWVFSIMVGKEDPGKEYEEDFGADFLRESMELALTHARGMDIDFYPEEIYNQYWNSIFRKVE